MIARYSHDHHERYRIKRQIMGGEAHVFDVSGPIAPEHLERFRIGPKGGRK